MNRVLCLERKLCKPRNKKKNTEWQFDSAMLLFGFCLYLLLAIRPVGCQVLPDVQFPYLQHTNSF